MIEEYDNWEDSIRITFIELANYMNKNSNPLDYLIECCENTLQTGKWRLDKFTILNAKDELEKLRQSKRDLAHDLFRANQELVEIFHEKNQQ